MSDQIEFAIRQLEQVLNTITTRRKVVVNERNDAVSRGNFAEAGSQDMLHLGLVTAETVVRDQIRGLKYALAAKS
jgi:hypothetical protein